MANGHNSHFSFSRLQMIRVFFSPFVSLSIVAKTPSTDFRTIIAC